MPYTNPQYLVETDWLEAHLHDPELRIIEVTGVEQGTENTAKEACYDKRHIPGAVFLDVASSWGPFNDRSGEFPLTWPPQAHFEAVMGQLGVGNDSHAVLYASTVGQRLYSCAMWCTRAWWIMHHFGVHCAILNGALEKWIAEGRPVSADPGQYPPTRFRADPQWRRGIAYKEEVLNALQGDGSCAVVNALPADQFGGKRDCLWTEEGTHYGLRQRPDAGLGGLGHGRLCQCGSDARAFCTSGVLAADSVITYCGGGGCATTDAFALALLGYTRVAMYDNSLYEWGADPSLPMTDPSSRQDTP